MSKALGWLIFCGLLTLATFDVVWVLYQAWQPALLFSMMVCFFASDLGQPRPERGER